MLRYLYPKEVDGFMFYKMSWCNIKLSCYVFKFSLFFLSTSNSQSINSINIYMKMLKTKSSSFITISSKDYKDTQTNKQIHDWLKQRCSLPLCGQDSINTHLSLSMTKQITPVSCHNYRDAKNKINSAFPQIQRPETELQINKKNVKRKKRKMIYTKRP